MSYPNEEVNCTKPCLSVSLPIESYTNAMFYTVLLCVMLNYVILTVEKSLNTHLKEKHKRLFSKMRVEDVL